MSYASFRHKGATCNYYRGVVWILKNEVPALTSKSDLPMKTSLTDSVTLLQNIKTDEVS